MFFLFSLLVLKSQPSFSQESTKSSADAYFHIEMVGTIYTKDILNNVFSTLDYCGMLNPNQSYTITLDDSSIVRIHAFSELKETNLSPSCIRENDLLEEASWLIKEGVLIKMVQAKLTK